jgi:chemotaxis protein methyltransferase CheR
VGDDAFEWLRRVIRDYSGIALGPEKQALLVARVTKRMRVLGLDDPTVYVRLLRKDRSGQELDHLIDVISTNVTGFFRERRHFEVLAKVFGGWLQAGQRRFRLWSTACSTGEEPCSMAISLLDAHDLSGLDLRILATDISRTALETCRQGVYPKHRMDGLSPIQLQKYFQRESEHGLRTVQAVRERITYVRLNLSAPPFPMRGPLDAIFCRNVMIYFDRQGRIALLHELFRLLRPGGLLCVGFSEGITGLNQSFKVVEPSVFVRP